MKPQPNIPVCIVCAFLFWGCTADPRSIRGAIAYANDAIADDEPARLFNVIDERSRHAMASIVSDRRKAATEIRSNYPDDLRAAALAELGDAATVDSPAELFALRCPRACREAFGRQLAAPERVETDGQELVVHTVAGAALRFYRRKEGEWWGLVWQVEEFARERARANRDLKTIRENATTYARRRALGCAGRDAERECW